MSEANLFYQIEYYTGVPQTHPRIISSHRTFDGAAKRVETMLENLKNYGMVFEQATKHHWYSNENDGWISIYIKWMDD